jgi:D-lactate dehydrogenase
MKIAFFGVKDWEKDYLKGKLKKHNLKFFEESINDIDIKKIKDIEVISVFIYSDVNKKILDNLSKLKSITTRSTGFDHIDIKECKKRKIRVCNVPYYGENTVAEHTFGLILALSRNIHKSYVRTLRDDFSIEGLTGFDLKDKTIGIIGGGHIGMHVARMANGFEMNVLVFDLHRDSKKEKKLGFKYENLNNILKKSDIISLHVPYNKHTHHLIDKKKIKLLKKDAIIINTSRGGIIDTNALLSALEKEELGGAGLDVIEGEELIREEKQLLHETKNIDKWKTIFRDHKIFRMDNVVFTPHNAFNSKEALIRILDTTICNIESFCAKKCVNSINF